MTVLLVVLTFAAFIVVDYLLHRKRAPVARPTVEGGQTREMPVGEACYVDGFLVPENLRYHPGHSWVLRERKRRVRVGIDEFAAALVGRPERIELPRLGVWLRQGQRALTFYRDGEKTEVVSPTEGEVVEINPDVLLDPTLVRKDPYGRGWMMVLDVPDEDTMNRNLVPEGFVQSWMRATVDRLYALQPSLAGAVAADGGRPTEDLVAALPDASWRELTQDFFLTK